MTCFFSNRIPLGKNETKSQDVLPYTALLVLGIALNLLIFASVNAAMAALSPLFAQARIQAEVSVLGRDVLDTQQQQARQELENAGERAVPALLTALRSDNAILRRNAADMLSYIPSSQAVGALRYTLVNDAAPEVRASAAEALGEIQDASTLDALQQASVFDASQIVHAAAIDSVARFHIAY